MKFCVDLRTLKGEKFLQCLRVLVLKLFIIEPEKDHLGEKKKKKTIYVKKFKNTTHEIVCVEAVSVPELGVQRRPPPGPRHASSPPPSSRPANRTLPSVSGVTSGIYSLHSSFLTSREPNSTCCIRGHVRYILFTLLLPHVQ